MEDMRRILGSFTGDHKGPLLICIGGIHGNEPAGVEAIRIVLRLLEAEPLVNPGFRFAGKVLGLAGNVQALSQGRRYIESDLNRGFLKKNIEAVMKADPDILTHEAKELYEMISVIRTEVESADATPIVILDLHTTSADGGIFVIASDSPESIKIGTELHAPVILDFTREVRGTALEYFSPAHFGHDVVSVAFESGQHQDPLSVNRAIAAIINCMRTIGCVCAEDVENRYDALLQEYSKGLPKVARLVQRYPVRGEDPFLMTRPYRNFEPIHCGETIAYMGDTPVYAEHTGMILLPRLQELGDDGFFIVTPVDAQALTTSAENANPVPSGFR
jgi:succinylglutamate desuccinylase